RVVLPDPDGPMSARKSPRGISRLTPCSTSIRSPPRWYTLWTFRTVTRESDITCLQLAAVPLRLNLYPVSVFERRRTVSDDALPPREAGEHFDLIPIVGAELDRAPLDAIVVNDKHDRPAIDRAGGRLGHQNARARLSCAVHILIAQERYLHAHVRQDA